MAKEEVLGSLISIGTYEEMLDELFNLGHLKQSSYVCFANVHMVIEAHRDKSFRKVVNEADIATPDGRPISLFLRFFRKIKQNRVCGMDVLPDLLKRASAEQKSVYFYGSTDSVLQAIRDKATRELPTLQISGMYSPPFRSLTEKEQTDIIDRINQSAPDFVLVALGCPTQEQWMAQHKGKVNACMLGLGQAFNTYAGLEKRLPKWMRDLSLEWTYRLYTEPGRLWKRYLSTNTLFLWLTFCQLFSRKKTV